MASFFYGNKVWNKRCREVFNEKIVCTDKAMHIFLDNTFRATFYRGKRFMAMVQLTTRIKGLLMMFYAVCCLKKQRENKNPKQKKSRICFTFYHDLLKELLQFMHNPFIINSASEKA